MGLYSTLSNERKRRPIPRLTERTTFFCGERYPFHSHPHPEASRTTNEGAIVDRDGGPLLLRSNFTAYTWSRRRLLSVEDCEFCRLRFGLPTSHHGISRGRIQMTPAESDGRGNNYASLGADGKEVEATSLVLARAFTLSRGYSSYSSQTFRHLGWHARLT